jgi:hypothetical protein
LGRPLLSLWAARRVVGCGALAGGDDAGGARVFAQSLAADDQVALEATGNALAIARIIEPHVDRVVLAVPKAVKNATQSANTDRLDACTLARLLAAGFLPAVWTPDEQTRVCWVDGSPVAA